jgi:hypothetical protein
MSIPAKSIGFALLLPIPPRDTPRRPRSRDLFRSLLTPTKRQKQDARIHPRPPLTFVCSQPARKPASRTCSNKAMQVKHPTCEDVRVHLRGCIPAQQRTQPHRQMDAAGCDDGESKAQSRYSVPCYTKQARDISAARAIPTTRRLAALWGLDKHGICKMYLADL